MKRLSLVVTALAITVGCGGGARDEAANNADTQNRDTATVGTGGEVTNNTTATTSDNRSQGAGNDVQRWVQDVSMHNTAEIELGRLASERGTNAEVKKYGEMMVRDHTMAGNELKQAVGTQIQLHEQMDEKHRDLAQKLRGMQGMEFDREYMDAMVDGHEQVKDMLEDRAGQANNNTGANRGTTGSTTGANTSSNNSGANATSAGANNAQVEMAVNQWAAKTLPTVEQHLQQAEQLRDRVRNSGRTTQNNSGSNNDSAGTRNSTSGKRTQ